MVMEFGIVLIWGGGDGEFGMVMGTIPVRARFLMVSGVATSPQDGKVSSSSSRSGP